MVFYNILRYVIFNNKLWQPLVVSAQTFFLNLALTMKSDPQPPDPHHPLTPTPWQSFVYSFGHYSKGMIT